MEEKPMKKDLIFAPIMLVISVLQFLFRYTGLAAHIAISVIGIFVLAIYTAATRKKWDFPVLEIVMRVFYAVALITGPVMMKLNEVIVLQIAHKVGSGLFVILLVALFVYKLIPKKESK